MRSFLILMRPLWREMIGSFGRGLGMGPARAKKKKKGLSRGASIALLLCLFAILAAYSTAYGIGMTRLSLLTGNRDGFIFMAAVGAPVMILLLGTLQIIPSLYHESSLELLLVLPVKPAVIIAAKMTQAFLPVTVFPSLVFLPGLIAHGVLTDRSWLFYIQLIPFTLLVLLPPFVLITLLIMLLMRYTGFARDKDRFQMVSSTLAVLIAVALSLAINLSGQGDRLPGSSLVASSTSPFLEQALRYLPTSRLGAAILVRSDSLLTLLYGLAALAVNGLILALLLSLANRLYLPGVMGLKTGGRRPGKLNREEQNLALAPRKAYRALVSREWKILLRTPAFFSQTILGAILLPLLLIGVAAGTLIKLEQTGELGMSPVRFLKLWASSGRWIESSWLLVLSVSGAAAFFSGTNMMSASAISRQGSLFSCSKLIPVPVRTQVAAWLTPGLQTMTVIWLLLSAALTLFLGASAGFGLVVFITAWVNSYLVQMAGFYTDMCFPRLDWSNEIQAVKNTRAAIVSGLGIFVYAGLLTAFGFMVRWLSGQGSTATALSLFLFSLLWSLLASRLVIRRAGKLFRLLEL